jgi:hypothetical protein
MNSACTRFATEALAAEVSIFQLSRLLGASVETIEMHYGHLAATPKTRYATCSRRVVAM